MTTTQVMVTKYISCDKEEFTARSECEAHEREVRKLIEHELYDLLREKWKLRYAVNEARINARIAWLDAQNLKPEARSAMGKSEYCKLMSEYWRLTSVYNAKRRELFEVRRRMSMAIDDLYTWFGLRKKQSSVARLERRRRSEMWRQEHTPDQWRTPHKIRVSKLPAKECE